MGGWEILGENEFSKRGIHTRKQGLPTSVWLEHFCWIKLCQGMRNLVVRVFASLPVSDETNPNFTGISFGMVVVKVEVLLWVKFRVAGWNEFSFLLLDLFFSFQTL